MAYASSSDVAILTPHLLPSGSVSGSDFSASTYPTLNAVNSWLSSGCAIINTKLASYGYDAIGATSGAYEFARDLNALYGAWRAERSLLSSRVSKMENSRADFFKKDFYEGLDMLCKLDLSNMGVTRGKAPPADYLGGMSQSDKELTESDTDRVVPRFESGQFKNQSTQKPQRSKSDQQTRNDP